MPSADSRPVYLNLAKIKFPVNAIISGLHRISGILLSLAIPFFLYLFYLSTRNVAGYAEVQSIVAMPLIKLALVGALWSICHHLFAGVRFLLIDIEVGVDKHASRTGAWLVVILSLISFGSILVKVML